MGVVSWGLFLAWVGVAFLQGKGMSSTQSRRDFQGHSGYLLNQTWGAGSDPSGSNPASGIGRVESGPRGGVLNRGCSLHLSVKIRCSSTVCPASPFWCLGQVLLSPPLPVPTPSCFYPLWSLDLRLGVDFWVVSHLSSRDLH